MPPPHLAPPAESMRTVGTLAHETIAGNGVWVIDAEPHVVQMARRLFPGCDQRGGVRFYGSTRRVEDLLWLMQRYPLKITDSARSELEAARDRAVRLAAAREARIERAVSEPANFRGELRPFQRIGVGHLIDSSRTINADDMGLGKTVQAIAAAAHIGEWPVVIVCPSGPVVHQWAQSFEDFLMPAESMSSLFQRWCCVLTGTTVHDVPRHPVYILHWGLLRHWADWIIEVLRPRTVIFDECQELRREESRKYTAALRLSESCERAWGLSGTPIYNYGIETWSVYNAVDDHCLGDKAGFTREWCTHYGGKMVRDPEALGAYLRREGLMLRRTKAEVAPELPPVRHVVQDIEHDEHHYLKEVRRAVEIARDYGAISDHFARGRALREIDSIARQAAGIAKAPYAAEFVRMLIQGGERVVVYAHHHAVYSVLESALSAFGVVFATGAQTTAQKREAVDAFASGKSPVIVCGLRTTAGIDGLQKVGTVCVFAELDWSPAVHSQCVGRLQRMGMDTGLESILAYYLVSQCESDVQMREALGLKTGQFVALMGDEGETEEKREEALRVADRNLSGILARLQRRNGAA